MKGILMSKIPNINCVYYTEFGRCINKNYSKWFFNRECILLDKRRIVCECTLQKMHPRPSVFSPPPPPPKRIIAEDITIKDLKKFFWAKEKKVFGEECYIVTSNFYHVDKIIGISHDKNLAIEIKDTKNRSIGADIFKVYKALIAIEK